MKKLNKTYISGIVCLLLGIWILAEIQKIPEGLVSNEPGPRMFPYIAAIGLIASSILSMIFDGPKEEKKPYLDKAGWKRMGLIFGELLLFAVGMQYVGVLLTGSVMTMVFILTLKKDKKINLLFAAALSVGLTCLIYFGFTKGFHIPLPTGELWEMLGIELPF